MQYHKDDTDLLSYALSKFSRKPHLLDIILRSRDMYISHPKHILPSVSSSCFCTLRHLLPCMVTNAMNPIWNAESITLGSRTKGKLTGDYFSP